MSSRQAGALALGALLLGGCGTPAGGDPGGRRLLELGSDRVFAALPGGATAVHRTRTPARYTQPGFTAGGWRGPSVVLTFASSAQPVDVYRFFARRAAAAGWRATSSGALGLTEVWRKTYPDGAAATLLLSMLPRAYILSGGVAPVVH
jgi:hypothetical protein